MQLFTPEIYTLLPVRSGSDCFNRSSAIFLSHGRQKGHGVYRGRDYTVDPIPKVKLEIVLADNIVDTAVQTISQTALPARSAMARFFSRASMMRSASATMTVARTRLTWRTSAHEWAAF